MEIFVYFVVAVALSAAIWSGVVYMETIRCKNVEKQIEQIITDMRKDPAKKLKEETSP